jgi:hypothetical protein
MNNTLSAMITFDTFDRQLSKYSLREPQIGDNVATGPATYNSEAQSFESPWPFGPEFNPQ